MQANANHCVAPIEWGKGFAYETNYVGKVSNPGSVLTIVSTVNCFSGIFEVIGDPDGSKEYTVIVTGGTSLGTTITNVPGPNYKIHTTTYVGATFQIYEDPGNNADFSTAPGSFTDGTLFLDGTIDSIFVTFTLYRAPLTLIFSLQGRILPYLVGLAREANHGQLVRITTRVVLGGVALALAGAAVGWLVGPEVVGLLYGQEYAPSATVAMFAAGGVMAASAAQVASQVLVAEGRTSRLSWAWLGGLVVAIVVILLAGGEPDTRVAVAFAAGEVSALGLMAYLAIRR